MEHFKRLFISSALVLGVLVPITAVFAAQYYNAPYNSQIYVDEHGVCQRVTNYNGYTALVPTNSSTEWSYFRSYAPSIGYAPCTGNQYVLYTSDTTPLCGYGTNYYEASTDASGNIYTRVSRGGYAAKDSGWVWGSGAYASDNNGYCSFAIQTTSYLSGYSLVGNGHFYPSYTCNAWTPPYTRGTEPNPNNGYIVVGANYIPHACNYTEPPPPVWDYCFIAGTMVRMADGSTKAIEEVAIGDMLLGMDGSRNEVLGFLHHPKKESPLYGFNGETPFATEDHPFMTEGGWKSINPEATKRSSPDLAVGALKVGDVIITSEGKTTVASIETGTHKEGETVYNFILGGNHTYYANGYLVSDYYQRGKED